jgi:two-component system, NarL family, sensor histidine kinase UhpB
MVFAPRQWSIRTQLLVLAIAPALGLLLSIAAVLTVAQDREVQALLQERGQLTVSLLAESAHFGLVSGNQETLRASMASAMAKDDSIAAITVHDRAGKLVLSLGTTALNAGDRSFTAEVRPQPLAVDVFDTGAAVSNERGLSAGQITVNLSGESLTAARRQQPSLVLAVCAMAAWISCLMAIALSKGMRDALAHIVAHLNRLKVGGYQTEPPALRLSGEWGELSDTLNGLGHSLQESTQALEDRVAQRTTELQSAAQDLEQAHADVRRLHQAAQDGIEEERRRIAIELHDTMNASLVVMRLQLQQLSHLTTDHAAILSANVPTLLAQLDAGVSDTYERTRRIVKQLRPEVLDTLGLVGALKELTKDFDNAHPSCRFRYEGIEARPDLPDDLALCLYRIAQECMSNVVKHAEAREAVVSLSWGEDERLTLSVRDDGTGLGKLPGKGLGLVGMRERVARFGGEIVLEESTPKGLAVKCAFPKT